MAVVLVDVHRLPRVADPLVADGPRGQVPAVGDVVGEGALLGLVLVLCASATGQHVPPRLATKATQQNVRGERKWQTRS